MGEGVGSSAGPIHLSSSVVFVCSVYNTSVMVVFLRGLGVVVVCLGVEGAVVGVALVVGV